MRIPASRRAFLLGALGWGDVESRACVVVVDGPLELSKVVIVSLKSRKSIISHFQNGLFGEKCPPEGTLPPIVSSEDR